MPSLWLSWPEDQHFTMDVFAANYQAVSGPHQVALIPGMGHGDGAAWNRPESYAFAQSVIATGQPWCQELESWVEDGVASATFASTRTVERAVLISTVDTGFTGDRRWQETQAQLRQEANEWQVQAPLPVGTTGWFFNLETAGLVTSSAYQQ